MQWQTRLELARLTGIDTERVVRMPPGSWAPRSRAPPACFSRSIPTSRRKWAFKLLAADVRRSDFGRRRPPPTAQWPADLIIGLAEELSSYHWIGERSAAQSWL